MSDSLNSRDLYVQRRRALIKQAKAYKELYDAIMQEVKLIERSFGVSENKPVVVGAGDTIAYAEKGE